MSKTVLILWSVLSLLVSGIFIFQGLLMFQSRANDFTGLISAVVVLSYGVITIFVQSLNWAKPARKFVTFTKYLVVLMFLNQFFFKSGIVAGNKAGLTGLAIVALMLAFNWLSFKFVAEHKK